MSYQFKVGDTVKYRDGSPYAIAEIHEQGGFTWCRSVAGSQSGSWPSAALTLVCPAGYRPVRKDEMDQLPQRGDAWLDQDGLIVAECPFSNTFRSYTDGEPWFRPLTKPDPDTKEDRNWISWYLEAVEDGDAIQHYADDLTEQEAMEDAELTAKEGHICFVAKIVGKFVPLGSKWIPND